MSDAPKAPPLARQLEYGAAALQAVRAGRSLTEALTAVPAALRPGVQALTFHALRHLGTSLQLLQAMAAKPPAPPVEALLCLALPLLVPGGDGPAYAPHTVVDQAVAAVRRRQPGPAPFVNALLRRFLRERDPLLAAARSTPQGAWNHPAWWIAQLQQDWPTQWQALLRAAGTHPPMTLRVNRRRYSGAAYQALLAGQGRASTLLDDPAYCGQALVLHRPCAVEVLPGFANGAVSVQDASAQRAALLLAAAGGLPPGARVLDACAAPGGKTAHLLELADIDLLALDSDTGRLTRVRETLQRLGLRARLQAADAGQPQDWWDGQPFDAILLDAPCSASGIVRRHPDIPWLRRPADLPALAAQQARLLDALWPLLKPGGRLLYATCSVFKCEGQAQIDAFLQRHGAAAAALQPASPGHLLTLADNPGQGAGGAALHDGFYLALLRKT